MKNEREVLEDTSEGPNKANSEAQDRDEVSFSFRSVSRAAPVPKADQLDLITLVGPSAAGKTHMLAAIGSAGNVRQDTKLGANTDINFSFNLEGIEGDQASCDYVKTLRDDYDKILEGRGDTEGTDSVFRLKFGVTYDEPANAEALTTKAGVFRRASTPEPTRELATRNVAFELVDGSGGDLTTFQLQRDVDPTVRKRMDAHYEVLTKARAALICLPWIDESSIADESDEDLSDRDVQGLENILKNSSFAENAQLENIAVCFTKYEMAFLDEGANAHKKAIDPKIGLKEIRNSSSDDIFEALQHYLSNVQEGRKPNIRIFPCSTFGFVNGFGASNFYPSKEFPGLLTRYLPPDVWQEDPKIQDHFPAPLRNRKASTMWHPFNIGSPFFFAATGKVTGPISFSLEELL